MITCPVCENQQAQGVECDVCGRPLPVSLVQQEGHAPPEPEPVPGLEQTALDGGGAGPVVPLAADAPCVWCGHVQASGNLCDRCGMQRHRGTRRAQATEPSEDGKVRCPECGLMVMPASRCPNCGGRLPSEP